MITGETRLAAVIGNPVRHSLSPALHNAGFEASGADWRFVAFEVAPGHGAAAIAAMQALGIGGFAVTMPFKTEVAAAVDELDPAAAALRSVNTVVLRSDGSTYGTSTDGVGFVDSVRAAGFEVSGSGVAVIGAGAASRSIVDALGRAGAADVAVVNRTHSTALAACELAAVARVGGTGDVAAAQLVVNTTPVGMHGQEHGMALDAMLLGPDQVVVDIVYHPLETELLRVARAAGATVVDGLGMLVHQAIHQQRLWTGVAPAPATLRAAAEAELARRPSSP